MDAQNLSGGATDALIKSIRDIKAVQRFHAVIHQKQINQLPTELCPQAQAINEETLNHQCNAHFIPSEFIELFNMAIIKVELRDKHHLLCTLQAEMEDLAHAIKSTSKSAQSILHQMSTQEPANQYTKPLASNRIQKLTENFEQTRLQSHDDHNHMKNNDPTRSYMYAMQVECAYATCTTPLGIAGPGIHWVPSVDSETS